MHLKSAVILLLLFLRFRSVLSNEEATLEEGAPCILNDGTDGICLPLSDCPHASVDLKHLVFPKFCSFNLWNPIVCCLDCRTVVVEDRFFDGINVKFSFQAQLEIELTDSGKLNPQLNDYDKRKIRCLETSELVNFPCNKYEEFKDLDDSVRCYDIPKEIEDDVMERMGTRKNEYPHLALLGFGNKPDYADWLCSGSIISDQFILTAAHCTSSPGLGDIKFAAVGNLERTEHRRTWQIYDVVAIIIHPGYVPPSKYHDIALLETGTKIRYNLEVVPACLHRGEDMYDVATATGWGVIGPQQHPAEILKGVGIIKFFDEECMEAFPKHRNLINGYNSNTQTCYGDEEQMDDTCKGDSGGPLQIKNEAKKVKCLHTIIGVISYGRACGHFGSSGLYTRVAPYVPWIETITGTLS